MCRRVSLRSFKYFLFSSVIVTALLIYIFCYKLVSYTADSTLAKDSNTSDKASSWQNDRLGESISTQPEQATNSSAMALLSGRGLVIKNSSKGDIKNTIGGSSKQTLKPHWTITNSSSSYKRSGTYTHVAMDSANGKLDPSVYGELGCPKNPKRKDFYEILQHWIQICKQNNIEYVLAYGSLLGAMRDADVIPYDSDVDVLVDHNYFLILKRLSVKRDFNPSDEKLRLVVQPEFALNISMDDRRRFNCEGKETSEMEDKCSFQEPMARIIKDNLFLDVFPFYNRVDVVEDPSEGRLKHYHKNDFYPFRPCSFMGLQASCPNNSWEVLRIYFGSENLEPIHKCKNGSWGDIKKGDNRMIPIIIIIIIEALGLLILCYYYFDYITT